MKSYNIEGNIDFFSELYKSLDIEENNQKMPEDDNLCLISSQPLIDKFVTLTCGHKFNYIPLYYDIKNHKQKYNNLEGKHSQLKYDEIRCPYCRNKQQELLPYYEDLEVGKIHGVNFIDLSKKNYIPQTTKKCDYLTPNPDYDPSGNNPVESANKCSGKNCKFFTCYKNGFYQLCQYINNYQGENMHLCCLHKNKMVKEDKINLKIKEKELKIKENELKKKEKMELKLKEKEDKQKAKEQSTKTKTKTKTENIVLGPSIIETECVEIIKYGPNKGKSCGCKAYTTGYCKRHTKEQQSEQQPKI